MPVTDPAAQFTPAPLPPIQPDGGLELPPATLAPLRVLPISRCDLGPCRHLHEITNQIDAQEPLDGSPGHIHTATGRSCYAQQGVDGALDAPVFDCNLWRPRTAPELEQIVKIRSDYERTHKRELAEFEESWSGRVHQEGR